MESALTACVEGIERLLEASEQSQGLTREIIDRKRWKKLAKDVRKHAAPIANSREEISAVNRALAGVPAMHLLERIDRMVRSIRPKWRALPLELLQGAPDMIKARNDIVHGRLVDDYSVLRIELLRAQLLFERLWLGMAKCGDLEGPGWSINAIRMHTAERELRDQVGKKRTT